MRNASFRPTMAARIVLASRVLAAAVLVAGSPALLYAQASDHLAGRWSGAVTLPGGELRVAVELVPDTGRWRGTIDIPQQNAQGLPLTAIRTWGDSVTFAIDGVPGEPTFLGALVEDGGAITGTFRQGPLNAPFRLERLGDAAASAALDELGALVRKALADFRVPGAAVGILHRGQVVYAEGFGYRDVANRLPVTPRTVFAIGSSTKAFTTFALGLQVDRGRFEWDRPVREYLPGLQLWDPIATAQLSGRDMVTHRSGLPRHDLVWYNNPESTAEELFDRLRYFEPNRQLREQWQYNNIMYVLAGHLLSRLSGSSWEETIRRDILAPLGMTSSSFSVAEMQRAPDHALPYRERGDTLVLMNFRAIDNVGPAGSINSNIEDMLRWARVHVSAGQVDGRRFIEGGTLRDMHSPHMVMPGFPSEAELSPASYGLGWMIQTYRGRYRVQHGGNIDGFSALVTLFPRDELAIVVLTNKNATNLTSLVTDHAADRLLGLPYRDWLGEAHARLVTARAQGTAAVDRLAEERKSGTRPAFPLEEYAGEYRHDGYGAIRIERHAQQLVMHYNGIRTPLEHWHYEVFSGLENVQDPTFHRAKLQFAADLRGRVAALTVAMEPSVPPIRFQRQPDPQLSDPQYLQRFAGPYHMAGGGMLQMSVRGRRLVMELPGQAPYVLVPDRDNEFVLSNMSGYSVRFVLDPAGAVTEVRLVQPNGIFTATRTRQ